MMIWEPKQSNEHFKKKEEQLKILVKRQSRFLETGQWSGFIDNFD